MENKIVQTHLTLGEWNLILSALIQRPFAEVSNLINKLNSQIGPQVQDPQIGPQVQDPQTIVQPATET